MRWHLLVGAVIRVAHPMVGFGRMVVVEVVHIAEVVGHMVGVVHVEEVVLIHIVEVGVVDHKVVVVVLIHIVAEWVGRNVEVVDHMDLDLEVVLIRTEVVVALIHIVVVGVDCNFQLEADRKVEPVVHKD